MGRQQVLKKHVNYDFDRESYIKMLKIKPEIQTCLLNYSQQRLQLSSSEFLSLNPSRKTHSLINIYGNDEITIKTFINEVSSLNLMKNVKPLAQIQQDNTYKRQNLTNINLDDTLQNVWKGLIDLISSIAETMIRFIKCVPGIDDLNNNEDFGLISNRNIFNYFLVCLIFYSSFEFFY
jgi:hypothetical protein